MNSKILSVLKWIAFVTFLINLHAPISAEETLQNLSENTSSATGTYEQVEFEQVEEDLGTQGFLTADPDPANALDEESSDKATEADTLEKASSLESAAPMMATMATVFSPSVPTYQEAIRDIATNLPNPEISMKLGSAVMDCPFRVPMGRNRLTPTVSLTYRASHSDGIAGVGWDLNIPSITRSLKRGGSYTSNAFTLNGEDLVLMADDGDAYGTYRFEKEEDFDHIEFRPDNSWTITRRDGTVFTYGSDDDCRQSNLHGTFRWLLSSVTDSNGNRITYTYTPTNPQDPDNKGPYFLAGIEYADYYTLNFYYEPRPDSILSYASKSKIITTKRLKTVTVGTSDEPIRAWDIEYRTSANTGRSLLERITEYGRDFTLNADNAVGSGTHLPPTEIGYDDSAIPISSSVHDIAGSALMNGIYSVPQRVLTGDWNGDGLTDIGRIGDNGGKIYTSTGTGFVMYTSSIPNPYTNGNTTVKSPLITGDFTGDGKTDLAWLHPSDISVFSPQGTANDMISQVTGTSGSITTLAYSPSLDQAKGNLPMILQLVTRITTDDGLGNTAATTFSYAAPLFDYSEREARSFGEVTRTNPDLTTETFRFHQDRFRDGKLESSEHRASDGTKLSETIEFWESTPYDSESAFIRMTGKTKILHENNQTAVKQETFTYDTSHGSVLTHTVSGSGLTESYTTAYTYDYCGSGLD